VLLNTRQFPRLESDGKLERVMLHEIGHVLGIGSLWSRFDLLQDPSLPDNREADPHFAGPLAVSAFDAVGGADYPGGKVTVENDFEHFSQPRGSLDSHWRTTAFGGELMVGRLDPNQPAHPISAVTVASLADLGYEVNMSAADVDPIEFHGDVYRGPIRVVDRDGRLVG